MIARRRYSSVGLALLSAAITILLLSVSLGSDITTGPSLNDTERASKQHEEGLDRTDTSIIITSNLIPTHPSVAIINETIHSLHRHLNGLPRNVQIFLSVDGLHPNDAANQTNQIRLAEYIHRLNTTKFPFHNIAVVPAQSHLHIARTVKQAMDLVTTKFVYVLQHDLPFVRDIYHAELIQAMNDHPSTLRIVLFKLEHAVGRFPVCPVYNEEGVYPKELYQGLDFYATKRWSDNNHFTTKAYYDEMFSSIDHLRGAMEWGMMGPAKQNCSKWGQVVYGTRGENYLKHLDGRFASG